MEVSKIQSTGLIPFNRPQSVRDDAARAARETLSRAGEARTNQRDILFNSFVFSTRKVPTLEATGPLAVFRVVNAFRFLDKRVESANLPLTDNLDKKPGITDRKLDRLSDLKISLGNLRISVLQLRSDGALNTRNAKSSRPALVQALAGKNSPLSSFSVTPTQLAGGNVLVSDEQSAPLASLGLSGDFTINGVKVTVESTDSLFDIKTKINLGEDVNGNGILDLAEDINENGSADTIISEPGEFAPGLYLVEDRNGNGTLESSEDVNDNGRLDGGIAETNVVATVFNGRLVLTSLAGGRDRIQLVDDDSVLLSLGFFEANLKGFPVQTERQFTSGIPSVNLIQEPQIARIELDDETVTSDFNVITETIEDTTLILREVSEKEAQIRISIDASSVVNQIESLVNQFNSSMKKINDLLAESRIFAGDEDIQDIRNDLTLEPQEKTKELGERNRKIDRRRGTTENRKLVGIEVENLSKNNVQEVAVTSVIETIKSGITLPFKNVEKDLFGTLTSIGIRSREDDTFKLDRTELARALNVNTEETLDLLTDPETGILPLLDKNLAVILKNDLGEIDLKRNAVVIGSNDPATLAKNFQDFSDNATIKNALQNLIAVV